MFSAVSLLALAACAPAQNVESEVIKLGFIGPLTGEASPYGVDPLNGIQLAIQQRNDAGGINGKQIELVAEDARCTGADAASAAQKLVNIDQVVAILGGQCSGETLAAAPIAEAAQVVMISSISSSPDVSDAGDFIFRNYPSDALKSTAMAGYFAAEELTRVAIISENTDFAQAFRASLKAELGEDAVVYDELVEPGTKDFRTLITRLQDIEFDVFFPNAQTPAVMAAMMQQLREQGLEQPAVSHDVADTIELIEIAGEAVDGMRAINVPTAGVGTDFESAFEVAYGTPKASIAFAAHGYDAANVLLDAIEAVGTEGPAIRDYLYDLVYYDGVAGRFSFDESGDVVGIPYVLKEVQNGEWVTIADIDLQQ